MQSKSPSVSLWTLRILATLWLAQLLAQIVLAASFVSGDTDLFTAHSLNGSMMNTLPFFMIVAGVLHATAGRGRWWLAAIPVGLLLVCETQSILGYTRVVGAHIVGGTTLLTVATLWCLALWRHRHRPRPRRRDRSTGAPTEPVETVRSEQGALA